MLVRRLVAGPSRTIFRRQMATAALAECVDYSTAASSAPSTSTSAAAAAYRAAPRAQRVAVSSASSSEAPATRSAQVEQLIELVNRPVSEAKQDSHDVAWAVYSQLTGQERAALTPKELARVLRSVVPRYQHYWNYLYRTPKRAHYSLLSVKVAGEWELRMRAVMGDLVGRGKARNEDWWFVLRTLSNMGLVTTCEAICRDLPDDLRYNPTTSEFRLGAIVRWARNLIDTDIPPKPEQVEYAYDTFWEIFRNLKSTHIDPFTLRLLLTSTAELATLVKSTGHKESLDRLSTLVNFIVHQGYGIDLNNIPMSVQQAHQVQGTADEFPPLSAKALTAIVRHLVVREIDPYRLVSAFEVLSVKESVMSSFSSRVDEDDDDDFGPVSQVSDAQQVDFDRRNWMGFKVKQKGASSFFNGSATSSSPAELAASDDSGVFQGRRFRLDYLPAISPLPTIPTPASPVPLPSATTYNDEAIVIILNYLRSCAQPRLFTHVLETALYDAKASQAAWLPAYLSCPKEKRAELYQPLRIAPEWFRIAMAYSAEKNASWSHRFGLAIRDALQWTQSFADIVLATEAARGVPIITHNARSTTAAATTSKKNGRAANPATASTSGRPLVPTPDFATNPQTMRILRNDHVFIVSEALKSVYHDLDQLEGLTARASELVARREKRYRK